MDFDECHPYILHHFLLSSKIHLWMKETLRKSGNSSKKGYDSSDSVRLFRVTGVAHGLQVIQAIGATLAFWDDVVYGHQLEIGCIQVNMKTAICIFCLDQVNTFFSASGRGTLGAMRMKDAQPAVF